MGDTYHFQKLLHYCLDHWGLEGGGTDDEDPGEVDHYIGDATYELQDLRMGVPGGHKMKLVECRYRYRIMTPFHTIRFYCTDTDVL